MVFFSQKKWLTSHTERKHQKKSKPSEIEKPKTDFVNTDNRTLLVGTSYSGKTYFMLKILSRITPDRGIYIFTKSHLEQYPNSKPRTKEIGDEIKPLSEYENAIIVLDDGSGSSDIREIDHILIRVTHNKLDFYCLSQSYFGLPKRTKRNNSNKNILFNQTSKAIKTYIVTLLDMIRIMMNLNNCEGNLGKMNILIFVQIDIKKIDRGGDCTSKGSKNTYLECIHETKLF